MNIGRQAQARWHRVLALSMLVALAASIAMPLATSAKMLEPMVVGWEFILKLDWQMSERKGRPVIAGTIKNTSPYHVTKIQLLVDGLDDKGTVVGQRVSWARAGDLGPFGHMDFEVPPPKEPAATYRVRVFAYDRMEFGTGNGDIR